MNNFSEIQGREIRISKIPEDIPVGILSFNAYGIIDFVNSAFSKMGIIYHLKTSTMIGSNIFEKEIFPGVTISDDLNELKNGFPFEKEIRNLKTGNGSELSVIIKCSPFYENYEFAGGILVLEDLKIISGSREEDYFKIESFKKISNEFADLFFIVNNQGEIKYSSGSKLNLLSSNQLNKNIINLIPNLPGNFHNILADSQAKGEEKRIILKQEINGELFHYECFVNPLSAESPSKFLTCIFLNISDKIKSQNLEDKVSLFETVADIASDGIIGISSEGKINFWSNSVLSLTGYGEEETLGNSIWNFIPAISQKSFYQLKEDLQQIRLFKKEIIIINKTGIEIPAEASFFLGNENNILISLSVSKELRGDFKILEENFRSLVTKTDVIVLRLSKTGSIEYLNPAFTSQLNFKEEEAIGKNLTEFLTPGTNIDFELFQNKSYNFDLDLLNKRGEKINYSANLVPVFNENVFGGFNVYLNNLSGKKKEEKNLQVFKLLFENTREGIAVEKKGKIVTANNAFGKLFGYSFGNEIAGKDILDLTAPNDVLKVAEYLQLSRIKKDLSQPFEFSGKRKNGSVFFCELTTSSFEVDDEGYFILIIRDITERKHAQQVIKESEEKYRNLIENIDDFLYTLERSRLFFKPVFFTNSVSKITGYSQTEMLGDSRLLLKIIHPDDLIEVKAALKNISKSKTKMSAELEFRIINKQGNITWIRNKLNVLRNESGGVQKVYGLVSDISLRKKAEEELKKSTENLVKLNETKDRFISIISHDLRTPFSSILGFTDLILNDDTLSDTERNQYVSYIQESSNSMLSLVNSLLDWTRLQTGRIRFEPEKIDVYETIIKSINALSGAAFQKNISLNSEVQENLFVYVDEDLIVQVFNNLISNAIKFTREGGSVTISAIPSQHARFYEFSVKDTGVGIRSEDAKKLFGVDTKFTTEGTAGEKGTGLGLSLVKEIIEKHGGTIRVESELGTGTNFLFTLPVAAANILLVDPNTTDRILYSKILKHITSDYNVETCTEWQ